MPRTHRIILLLFAGTLTVLVFLAVGNWLKDSAADNTSWTDRIANLYNNLFWDRDRMHARSSCIANLKQIDGAKATWALENKKTNSDIPTTNELYGSTNYIRDAPYCPQGGKYTLGRVDERVRCSIPGHTI